MQNIPLFVGVCVGGLALCGVSPAFALSPMPYTFDGQSFDTTMWQSSVALPSAQLQQDDKVSLQTGTANPRFCRLPGHAGSTQINSGSAGFALKDRLHGDFSVSIDFANLTTPMAAHLQFSLAVHQDEDNYVRIRRLIYPGADGVQTEGFYQGSLDENLTDQQNDATGVLTIKREDGEITTYFNGVQNHDMPAFEGDATVFVQLLGPDNEPVAVDVDNFYVIADGIVANDSDPDIYQDEDSDGVPAHCDGDEAVFSDAFTASELDHSRWQESDEMYCDSEISMANGLSIRSSDRQRFGFCDLIPGAGPGAGIKLKKTLETGEFDVEVRFSNFPQTASFETHALLTIQDAETSDSFSVKRFRSASESHASTIGYLSDLDGDGIPDPNGIGTALPFTASEGRLRIKRTQASDGSWRYTTLIDDQVIHADFQVPFNGDVHVYVSAHQDPDPASTGECGDSLEMQFHDFTIHSGRLKANPRAELDHDQDGIPDVCECHAGVFDGFGPPASYADELGTLESGGHSWWESSVVPHVTQHNGHALIHYAKNNPPVPVGDALAANVIDYQAGDVDISAAIKGENEYYMSGTSIFGLSYRQASHTSLHTDPGYHLRINWDRIALFVDDQTSELAGAAISPGAGWHDYRVVARGDEHRVFMDGALVFTVQDSTHEGPGYVGIFGNDTVAYFENFQAREASSLPPLTDDFDRPDADQLGEVPETCRHWWESGHAPRTSVNGGQLRSHYALDGSVPPEYLQTVTIQDYQVADAEIEFRARGYDETYMSNGRIFGLSYRKPGAEGDFSSKGYHLHITWDRVSLNRRDANGALTELAAHDVLAPDNAWHDFRVVANGSAHEVYRDGSLLFTVQDSSRVAPGHIGFFGMSSYSFFDDLSITPQ